LSTISVGSIESYADFMGFDDDWDSFIPPDEDKLIIFEINPTIKSISNERKAII
jgi:hypothetical protein